jgi:hypothetical protein
VFRLRTDTRQALHDRAAKEVRMSSPKKTNGRLSAPHCNHCGFEMTPMQLGHSPGIKILDQVYECRSCGVMTMPDSPATSASPPVPAR